MLGHVGREDVLPVRSGSDIFAIDAHCSHYHGPLAEGLVVDESIRCPWHHACFDLRTGEPARAPALNPLTVWQVEHAGERIVVRQKRAQPKRHGKGAVDDVPDKIVIVGGGAAGFAAAEMLRREDYRGSIVMLSNDSAPPVDRPNLSKRLSRRQRPGGPAAAPRKNWVRTVQTNVRNRGDSVAKVVLQKVSKILRAAGAVFV